MGHATSDGSNMRGQIITGLLMLIIGGLAGFGWSQMTVSRDVTEKLMRVQEGWNNQFAILKSTADQNIVKIANLQETDIRLVNAINGLHPIIEAAVQQNTLLLAWLKNYSEIPGSSNEQRKKVN